MQQNDYLADYLAGFSAQANPLVAPVLFKAAAMSLVKIHPTKTALRMRTISKEIMNDWNAMA